MQVLTAIDSLIATGLSRRVLIVAPAGLLGNWDSELVKWRKQRVIDVVGEDDDHRGATGSGLLGGHWPGDSEQLQ